MMSTVSMYFFRENLLARLLDCLQETLLPIWYERYLIGIYKVYFKFCRNQIQLFWFSTGAIVQHIMITLPSPSKQIARKSWVGYFLFLVGQASHATLVGRNEGMTVLPKGKWMLGERYFLDLWMTNLQLSLNTSTILSNNAGIRWKLWRLHPRYQSRTWSATRFIWWYDEFFL